MTPPADPTGLPLVDGLTALSPPTLNDYVRAASQYVRENAQVSVGAKKAAQIRLSNGLAETLLADLRRQVPYMGDPQAGERTVSGALRFVQADVSEIHPLDGLRLAVELKPVNLAGLPQVWLTPNL